MSTATININTSNSNKDDHSGSGNSENRTMLINLDFLHRISLRVFAHHDDGFAAATWVGFWALFFVTCANYVLTPIRDAVALQVGVQHMPKLTLASSLLAFGSSVPIGWLFEAPDPNRRKMFKRMGLTRGETQGTSLALFYRCFALSLLCYAVGFTAVEFISSHPAVVSTVLRKLGFAGNDTIAVNDANDVAEAEMRDAAGSITSLFLALFTSSEMTIWRWLQLLLSQIGRVMYIAFFLVVHLMKLHSLSLVWGVTTEAMEYEDVARKHHYQQQQLQSNPQATESKKKTRLQRLSAVSFGGTLGGILGSGLASTMANILHLPGLLVLSAILLEVSAELSTELGRIMQKHWEEQQIFKSSTDLASLDTSMKRSVSLGSMKRVASGNSLYQQQQQLQNNSMQRVGSATTLSTSSSLASLRDLDSSTHEKNDNNTAGFKVGNGTSNTHSPSPVGAAAAAAVAVAAAPAMDVAADDTFTQRLLRGIKTILNSRLLMAIFTYNALYASTSVLLSFQRAALVANRNDTTTVSADTAFLANINMVSSVAVFAMQASGLGASVAQVCGPRGSLALMPLVRLSGVLALAWWHQTSGGKPPNLIIFLLLDECTRVINLAVAKPVRESLWRGLSNEARYEAKPIVDTLANRWGGGSAAFLVSMWHKALTMTEYGDGGFPPVLFLCLLAAAWWTVVSVDLGQIRRRIDIELKKRQ